MKRFLLKSVKIVGLLLAIAAITYAIGPQPPTPAFAVPAYQPSPTLQSLEADIAATEQAEPGIKPGCEATILWADSSRKEKTKYAFLYLHGFGASRQEGAPVHEHLARQFGANLFLARLDEHGVEEGDQNLLELTADSYVESAEWAYQIAKQLGDTVVILGTSAGGALGLFLASRHPEIKALVTWSPCIRLFTGLSGVLAGPWGLQLARLLRGGEHNDWTFRKPEMVHYWTNHQRFEGITQFAAFLENAMVPATFQKVNCPVFVGYYYKNEMEQDRVVSVEAMLEMLQQLGTPPSQKRAIAFPDAADHVIASSITSSDWEGVERESAQFLLSVLHP